PASLVVIAIILAIATIASLIKSRQDPSLTAHAGTVTKPDREAD
ncbi:MAG TPA: tellurium resistance protein TerC, partial [Actinobacteria bacterium]|nr:tellurium resistance protein TerC [Actinomycetota bacterium]